MSTKQLAPTYSIRSSGRRSFLDRVDPSMYKIIASLGEQCLPICTVVVPVRNRKDLVVDTIQALRAQDCSERFEIIVVDNCSDDGTDRVLQSMAMSGSVPFTVARLRRDHGPAVARNVGVTLARGKIIAFTDSDCVPTPGWLRNCTRALRGGAGVVQGQTTAPPDQPQPLFNHFIETTRFDGSFSTSNVAYWKEAIVAAGGFDPGCSYWEDVDLGWRVSRLGWRASFEPAALVHHQVIELSPAAWLRHAARVSNYPAKVARYPEVRRYLSMRLWVDPSLVLFQGFVLGVVLGSQKRPFFLLTVPYLASLIARKRFVGRRPPLRAAAYVARDAVSFASLMVGSVRHRRAVL